MLVVVIDFVNLSLWFVLIDLFVWCDYRFCGVYSCWFTGVVICYCLACGTFALLICLFEFILLCAGLFVSGFLFWLCCGLITLAIVGVYDLGIVVGFVVCLPFAY